MHFDAHPDLCLPKDFNAHLIYDKSYVLNSVSIENWILPAAFAGHIGQIVWIKPDWSHQISPGKYNFLVGRHRSNGRLYVTCKLPYFLSELLYANEQVLADTKSVELYVCNLTDLMDDTDVNREIRELISANSTKTKSLIVDIDLDFFYTLNPFREALFDEHSYELFKRCYLDNMPKLDFLDVDDVDFDRKYEEYGLNKYLKSNEILKHLKTNVCVQCMDMSVRRLKRRLDDKIYGDMCMDVETLHSYGEGLDSIDLPVHRTEPDEFHRLFKLFLGFFKTFFDDKTEIPGLITIARSSLDNYCPPDQVEYIQDEVLDIIKQVFSQQLIKSISQDYSFELHDSMDQENI